MMCSHCIICKTSTVGKLSTRGKTFQRIVLKVTFSTSSNVTVLKHLTKIKVQKYFVFAFKFKYIHDTSTCIMHLIILKYLYLNSIWLLAWRIFTHTDLFRFLPFFRRSNILTYCLNKKCNNFDVVFIDWYKHYKPLYWCNMYVLNNG